MQLNHYLNFDGQTEVAFNFYKSVFGGEFATFMRYGDLHSVESSVTLSEADQQISCIFHFPSMPARF